MGGLLCLDLADCAPAKGGHCTQHSLLIAAAVLRYIRQLPCMQPVTPPDIFVHDTTPHHVFDIVLHRCSHGFTPPPSPGCVYGHVTSLNFGK